jgi:hypothetical protein
MLSLFAERKFIKLEAKKAYRKWLTPERNSQSLSSVVSPNGRYFYIVYLYGLSVLDTVEGTER